MKNILMSLRAFFSSAYERVRARDSKGRFVADDPNTKYTNEAYTIRKKLKKTVKE